MRHAPFYLAVLATTVSSMAFGMPENISESKWGVLDGKQVNLYTLENENGLVMRVTNFGCIVTELHVPDRDGNVADIVLGHDNLHAYIAGHPYFGAIVGRYANRIREGRFELDGAAYQVPLNDGPNHLHGGNKGFDRHVWDASPMATPDGPAIRFTRFSPDGEQGYPGNLDLTVVYTLTNDNELKTEMVATTDAPTIANLAQHNYWNLAGHDSGSVADHVLHINAGHYTPVDETLIPTGEIAPVEGTPFDFTEPKPIGRDLESLEGDVPGYDHNFVLEGETAEHKLAARVTEPESGRVMELYTNQPGVQFYSGNFLDGSDVGKGETPYEVYNGFCLETQHFPDSINNPDWPSVVLRPGKPYYHLMVTKFSTD